MAVEVRGKEVEHSGIYKIHTWNFTVPKNPVGFIVGEAPISGDNGWQGAVYYDSEEKKFLTEEEVEALLSEEQPEE